MASEEPKNNGLHHKTIYRALWEVMTLCPKINSPINRRTLATNAGTKESPSISSYRMTLKTKVSVIAKILGVWNGLMEKTHMVWGEQPQSDI
jgi:hypothetical protein